MAGIIEESIEKLHSVFERTDIEIEWTKMQQKVEEARFNPGDLRPLADCMYSLLLAARSRGYRVDAVMQELEKVAAANLQKRWKQMPDGTYRSVPA